MAHPTFQEDFHHETPRRRTARWMTAAVMMLAASAAGATDVLFTDVAGATGLDFEHWNGMTGELHFIEMTGQGGALFDYDGDGDLDVYLVQGAPLPGEPLQPFPGDGPPRDRLFRNELDRGRLAFVDVTAVSGLMATGYGMGVAAGDVDNDGHVDLYVTNYGPNQLWRNRGDGTFEDVTAHSGTGDPRWSTSAAFLDFDGDGWLDLYVVNYVDYDIEESVVCYATSSRRDYCGPASFTAAADRLFRNRGVGPDGRVTFEDATLSRLRAYRPGPGLGVVSGDFNGDRRLDLYVANDGAVNQLWLQQADGTFRDEALLAGVAVNRSGQPEASMGIDAGDADGDGDLDLVLAHLTGETNTLYLNDGGGIFTDRSVESGLATPSFAMTAFGAGWLDVDNDGWLDLLVVNGAVKILESQAREGSSYPLAQPNQLFLNRGGRFEDVTARAGEAFALAEVSRGAAFGDVDNDGDTDVLVTNSNGRARLLRNEAGRERAWLGLRVVAGRRDALGAVVTVEPAAGAPIVRRARTDGSYCSSHDPRILIGLAGSSGPVTVRVDWPDGTTETWRDIPLNRYTTLRRGTGTAPS